jgi:hypothetical protein
MEQTAVEWLLFELSKNGLLPDGIPSDIHNKAKEMEKNQISKAFLNGRLEAIGPNVLFDLQPLTETFYNYYNKKFKTKE